MTKFLMVLTIILALTVGFVGGVLWSSLRPSFNASPQEPENIDRQQVLETTLHEQTLPLVGPTENGGFIIFAECSWIRTSGVDLYYDPEDGSTICVAAPGGTAYAGQPYKPRVSSMPSNCALIPEQSTFPPSQRPESDIAPDQRVYCATVPQLNNEALEDLYERGELPQLPG